MFLFNPLCMYHLASAQQNKYIWGGSEIRAQQEKGVGGSPEKSQMSIFPQVAFVLLRINFHHPTNFTVYLLPLLLGSAVPRNLTLHFGIRSTNHPATATKHHKATCLLQCRCSQCDGERLSDSKECLSPQISRAPRNRNVPCLASPVLPLL